MMEYATILSKDIMEDKSSFPLFAPMKQIAEDGTIACDYMMCMFSKGDMKKKVNFVPINARLFQLL